MARKEHKSTAMVMGRWLYWAGDAVQLDRPAWTNWLAEHTTFFFESEQGTFTARREQRGDGQFWYAYRRRKGKLYKAYLGKAEQLTRARLLTVAGALTEKIGA